jgi:hypothetical protein
MMNFKSNNQNMLNYNLILRNKLNNLNNYVEQIINSLQLYKH